MALTFQQLLDSPSSFFLHLVKLTPYKKETGWVLDSGAVYKKAFVKDSLNQSDPSGARFNAATLTLAASRGAMVAGSWFYDTATKEAFVWLAGGVNPSTGTVYISFVLYFSEPTYKNYFDPAANSWNAEVLRRPTTRRGRADTLGKPTVSFGDLVLDNSRAFWTGIWTSYFLDFVPIEILVTGFVPAPVTAQDDWLPWAEVKTVLKGQVTRQSYGAEQVVFDVSDNLQNLGTVFPSATFDLTAFPNLGSGLEGRDIHRGYGVLVGVQAALVNTATNVYKIDDKAISSIQAVYDTDGVTLARTDNIAAGEFTLTVATTKRVFADYTKTIGTSTRAGELKLELLQNVLNIPAADIDTASFTALDTASPYALGLSIPRRTTMRKIFEEINRSALSEDGTTRAGLLTTAQIKKPSMADPNQQVYTEYSDIIGQPAFKGGIENVAAAVLIGYGRDGSLPKDEQFLFAAGAAAGNDYPTLQTRSVPTLLVSRADALALAVLYKPFLDKPEIIAKFKTKFKPLFQAIGDTITFGGGPANAGLHWRILELFENGDYIDIKAVQ